MDTNLSILFYAKRSKATSDGLAPIYLRVTIDGQRIELSARRNVHPDKWSPEGNRVKGANAEARAINTYLDTLKSKIYDYRQQLINENKQVNAENMRNKILGVEKRRYMLVPIFQKHNDDMKALVGKDYAFRTHENYTTALNHVIHFMRWNYKVSDMDIRDIDHEFITTFEFYLKSMCNCCQNTAVKYIRQLGKVIRFCLVNGWIDRNPFINYKGRIKQEDRTFLEQNEVDAIMEKTFNIPRLAIVKDVFLFSCYTGLAYSDVRKLTRNHIGLGVDGGRWIFIHRTKTDTRAHIPILPIAAEIIEKYRNHPQAQNQGTLLPVHSNQKMNEYLKEVAQHCGIRKVLTFHVARHTFATTVTISNNVPIESVSKMLGHKDLRITQHYAKILDRKVGEDMQLLRERLSMASKPVAKVVHL